MIATIADLLEELMHAEKERIDALEIIQRISES